MKTISLKERLFLKYLGWKLRPSRVKRLLQEIAPPDPVKKKEQEMSIQQNIITVSAVQQEFKLCRDISSFTRETMQPLKTAADKGSSLVVFPEYNGLMLLGMIPGMENLTKGVEQELSSANPQTKSPPGPDIPVRTLMQHIGPLLQKALVQIFSHLSAAFNIYIMAGTTLVPEGENLYNRSFLFAPGGELLGTQDKVHLFPTEKDWGVDCGHRFHVFPTRIGNLCMPICMDATYFETFRILKFLGGEIALLPIANAEPYNFYTSLRGLWPRVQESLLYGVKSALVGDFLHFSFTGKAEIIAPLELTPQNNGILAASDYPHSSDLVTASLDLNALHELQQNHASRGDINVELYERYLPQLYRQLYQDSTLPPKDQS